MTQAGRTIPSHKRSAKGLQTQPLQCHEHQTQLMSRPESQASRGRGSFDKARLGGVHEGPSQCHLHPWDFRRVCDEDPTERLCS